MQSSMTRQEQRILVIILLIITVGLAWQEYRRSRPRPLWVESAPGAQDGSSSAISDPASPDEMSAESGSVDPGGKLDLNRATAEELESLPGIGTERARDIVAYRESHGAFASVKSLDSIPGIGPSTLARLEPFVTITQNPIPPQETTSPAAPEEVGASSPQEENEIQPAVPTVVQTPIAQIVGTPDASKININTAEQEQLEQLDQIGEKTAQAIMHYRKQYGPFRKPEDLMNVPGIGPKKFELNRDRITVK